ncbi:hypothetical protein CTI14_40310 [Methylobacterium radiotolerans]|nr:hypothetical protein CTI14_40310 [Methylobacterium radiotolerans]
MLHLLTKVFTALASSVYQTMMTGQLPSAQTLTGFANAVVEEATSREEFDHRDERIPVSYSCIQSKEMAF